MSHRGQLQSLNTAVSRDSHSITSTPTLSPANKMATPQRSASQDSTADAIRKRVGKACDRCRLKKSKCDGSHPCTRCKADNAICVFGERKKSQDKIYPKGYVEMLEQQQSQLVAGLQEMYRRMRASNAWTGARLEETNGHPLTHDILAALGLLETQHDASGELENFEEDCGKLQSKLIARGSGFTHRRGSISSESEHSQGNTRSAANVTPVMSKPPVFKDSFAFSAPPSPPPLEHSPVHEGPGQQQFFHMTQPPIRQNTSPLSNDPQFYQAGWAYPEVANADLLNQSNYMQSPELDQSFSNMEDMSGFQPWDAPPTMGDAKYNLNMPAASYSQHFNAFGSLPKMQDGSVDPMDLGPMDVEFAQFLQVQT